MDDTLRFHQHKPPNLRCNFHRHRNPISMAFAASCSSQNPETDKAEASQPITSLHRLLRVAQQCKRYFTNRFLPKSHNDQPRARAPSPFCFPAIEALKIREFEHGCFLRSFAAAGENANMARNMVLCACLLLGDLCVTAGGCCAVFVQ